MLWHALACFGLLWQFSMSRKCWGFVKIEFLDKNLTFRIVFFSVENVVLWMIYHLKRVAKWRLDTGNKLLKNLGRKKKSWKEFYMRRRPLNSIHGKKGKLSWRCWTQIIFDVFLMILVVSPSPDFYAKHLQFCIWLA